MLSDIFHQQLVLTIAATYLVMESLWTSRKWIILLWMTDIQAREVDQRIIISFCSIGDISLIETAAKHSNSVAGGRKQRVDPVLPLILAHPENNTAPDASVPLSPDELAGM